MKKRFLLFVLTGLFGISLSTAQHHEAGAILFDAYYGFPNLATGILKGVTSPSNMVGGELKVGSIGPLGGRAEYLLSDRFGMGLNVSYASSSLKWSESDGADTYDYKLSYPRLRIMGTWNIHLGDNDKLDPYIGGGIGYVSSKLDFETNDPSFDQEEYDDALRFNMPLAWRIFEFGMRYYVTDNIGFNWNVGLGAGPLVGVGISAKL